MLDIKLDQITGIVVIEPDGELSENDFSSAAEKINPFIEANGELKG
jgi:hypothetical protein